jgi:hypothetical protein
VRRRRCPVREERWDWEWDREPVWGGAKVKGVEKGSGFAGERISPGACLLGQMGADMDDIVGEHSKSDPALDAVRTPIERSP